MTKTNNYSEILNRSHERCIEYGIEKTRIFPLKIFKGKELKVILK
jgi:hypothetical protein